MVRISEWNLNALTFPEGKLKTCSRSTQTHKQLLISEPDVSQRATTFSEGELEPYAARTQTQTNAERSRSHRFRIFLSLGVRGESLRPKDGSSGMRTPKLLQIRRELASPIRANSKTAEYRLRLSSRHHFLRPNEQPEVLCHSMIQRSRVCFGAKHGAQNVSRYGSLAPSLKRIDSSRDAQTGASPPVRKEGQVGTLPRLLLSCGTYRYQIYPGIRETGHRIPL